MIDKTNWNLPSIAWMAGILEGEGSFYIDKGALVVKCDMSDEDVVRKLHRLAGFGNVTKQARRDGRKDMWRWSSRCSKDVYDFEIIIYINMGIRRQDQIGASHDKRRDYEQRLIASGGHPRYRIPRVGG